MSDIDKEIETKTTQKMAMYGPDLSNKVGERGGCQDYGHITLTGQRLVDEAWFQGLIDEVRQGRKKTGFQSDSESERKEFDTGIEVLDDLLQEVFWIGQGKMNDQDSAISFMASLDEVIDLINKQSRP